MSEHPIEGMLGNTMEKIKEMVDVNTVIAVSYTHLTLPTILLV